MSDARGPVLELEGVRKSYGDAVVTEVLHGIDLVVERGELAALVGPSGSGKSTLLNLLGLLDRPSAGRIRVLGEDTAQLDEEGLTRMRGRALGFVFQFHHLLPALSAVENVAMPLAIERGRLTAADLDRARALLDEVGLTARADARAGELSGGQQQRVAIARALVRRPALVLADEPTGNLDTKTASEAFELMRRFHDEEGVSFLIVTHDPGLAARCDRRILLVDGAIAEDSRYRPVQPP